MLTRPPKNCAGGMAKPLNVIFLEPCASVFILAARRGSPRRCVERSPFCTVPVLEQIMELLGMRVVEKKTSPKVFFACARRLEQEPNRAAVAANAAAASQTVRIDETELE